MLARPVNAGSKPGPRELIPYWDASRAGVFAAVLALAGGLLLFAIWATTPTAFEQCNMIAEYDARAACFERARDQGSHPPAKGADIPPSAFHPVE
jgi:hypothetical protein